MDPNAIARTATLLASSRIENRLIPQLGESEQPSNISQGYDVQKHLHKILRKNGKGKLAGWKIGATTRGMQNYLGVTGPAYGRITANCVMRNGAVLDATSFCSPGIECEVAMRIGRPSEKNL